MSIIPSYPPALTPLSSEPVPIWQDGKQCQAPASALWGPVPTVDLFVNLATNTMPVTATAIFTGGYSSGGIGGGTYVADALATSALAAANPNFCAADSTGRYFRALPRDGKFPISMAGARGTPHNDQAAVQACVDYCKDIGCTSIFVDVPSLDLWAPTRSSPVDAGYSQAFALDGHPIVLQASMHFEGLPCGSTINFLGHTGGSPDTDWQNVGGQVWRGTGIRIMGGVDNTNPGSNSIDFFSARNMKLDAHCTYTGVRTAVTVSSPDGPDLTSHVIACQNTAVNRIWLEDVEICRSKGENFYFAPSFTSGYTTPSVPQRLNRVWIHDSNQSSFNPSVGGVDATDCKFGNSFICMEGLGGPGGRIQNTLFYNSVQLGVSGGPSNGLLYNYGYPTRDLTKTPPWFDFIDCEFVSIGAVLIGNYIRVIRGRATDCLFTLTNALSMGAMVSTYIDLEYTVDQQTVNPIINLAGPLSLTTVIPGAPAGTYTQPATDIHIQIRVHQTDYARANNRQAYVFAPTGFLNVHSCSLKILDGSDGISLICEPGFGGATPSLPLITCDGPTGSDNIYGGAPFAAYPSVMSAGPFALVVSNPRHALYNQGAAATIVITMDGSTAYANGQRSRIFWHQYSTTGTIYTFAENGTNMKLNGNRRLYAAGDWIELEYNTVTMLWHEVGYSSGVYYLNGSGSITPASLATASMAALGTVAVTNAAIGDLIESVSASTATGGVNLWGEVTAANTVTIYARNDKGTAYNPGATTFTITGHKL